MTRQARSAGCRRHRVRQVLLLCMAPARMRAAARRVATMAEQGGVWLGHFSAASYLHLASLRVPASGCPQHTLCGSRASIGAPRERTSTFFHVCTHLPRAAQGDGVQLHTVSSSLFSFVNLIPERTGGGVAGEGEHADGAVVPNGDSTYVMTKEHAAAFKKVLFPLHIMCAPRAHMM